MNRIQLFYGVLIICFASSIVPLLCPQSVIQPVDRSQFHTDLHVPCTGNPDPPTGAAPQEPRSDRAGGAGPVGFDRMEQPEAVRCGDCEVTRS